MSLIHPRTGVLLVNLGTPEGTDFWSVRRYLSEFLSDRRVVERNRVLWQVLLQSVILTTRPRRTAAAYRAIWRADADGSPLRHYTRRQAEKLADTFAASDDVVVDWAMRYGEPSIAARLDALWAAGCRRIVILPLYPQYSATTTATVNDAVFRHLLRLRHQPAISTIGSFCDHRLYIQALADRTRATLRTLDWQPDVLIASFHGLPVRYVERGDPYAAECARTVAGLRDALGLQPSELLLTYQSRFGRAPWLGPATVQRLRGLARQGIKRVAVLTPGFLSDCVETLEEIAIGGRDAFLQSGGQAFAHVPGLNDSAAAIDLLAALIRQELPGHQSSSFFTAMTTSRGAANGERIP
jgi:ferrochelatase